MEKIRFLNLEKKPLVGILHINKVISISLDYFKNYL